MRVLEAIFNVKGRVNRAWFWIGQLLAWQVTFAMLWLLAYLFFDEGWPDNDWSSNQKHDFLHNLGGFVACVAAVVFIGLVFNTCLCVRRLHDRGISGWYLLVLQGPLYLWMISRLPFVPSVSRLLGTNTAFGELLFLLVVLVAGIWAWIELGFRAGDAGENAYGPPPPPFPIASLSTRRYMHVLTTVGTFSEPPMAQHQSLARQLPTAVPSFGRRATRL